jgi:hypothetical protein
MSYKHENYISGKMPLMQAGSDYFRHYPVDKQSGWLSVKSGAKATALQTLTRRPSVSCFAERLDCGAFTAALVRQAARPATQPSIVCEPDNPNYF